MNDGSKILRLSTILKIALGGLSVFQKHRVYSITVALFLIVSLCACAGDRYIEVTGNEKQKVPVSNAPNPSEICKTNPDRAGKPDLETLLKRYTRNHQVELPLVVALMKIESNFDPKATSPVGARGLMQLMPETARQMGLVVCEPIDERLNPAKNLEAGIRYLGHLLTIFDNPVDAIAAYNQGPGNIRKGLPSNTETLQHVYKVMRQKCIYEQSVMLMYYDINSMLKKCAEVKLVAKDTDFGHS